MVGMLFGVSVCEGGGWGREGAKQLLRRVERISGNSGGSPLQRRWPASRATPPRFLSGVSPTTLLLLFIYSICRSSLAAQHQFPYSKAICRFGYLD